MKTRHNTTLKGISLRTKLIFSFSVVIIVGMFLSVTTGLRMIGNTIVKQAQDKVRLDLNSAHEVYNEESQNIKDVIRLTAARFIIKEALLTDDLTRIEAELQKIKEEEDLDMLTIMDNRTRVLFRVHNPMFYNDSFDTDIVRWVLEHKEPVVATQKVSKEELAKEGEALAEQARIVLIPTPHARPLSELEETSGMMIGAAAPIYDDNDLLIGILYGSRMVNQNYTIVDKVKNIIFRGEQYKRKDIGTVTIFQGDLRISTNVTNKDGSRAIGTRVSQEVYEHVIEKGLPWNGRAFVVNDWYRTAYEPIRDINGNIIGMLYVGVLEAPYVDLRNRVIISFLGIAFLSVILLMVIAYFSTMSITKPMKELLFATNKIAQGDLAYRVPIKSGDEIGYLADSFNQMTIALQRATEGYLSCTRTLEEKVAEKTNELEKTKDHLVQTEKLASLGRLAAGIAHEINNPLTSIIINSHLVAEKLNKKSRFSDNVKLIIEEADRCSRIVRGLLEFSRQSSPEKKPTDINKVIERTLLLFESQLLAQNMAVNRDLDGSLPLILIDGNKIEQVFTNVILNAIDATPHGGSLTITSRRTADAHYAEVLIRDTGVGLSPEHLTKIFDPFFTTKGIKGTGLGLSISYGIIQQHEGTIDVQSTKHEGTTVTIRLPINEQEVARLNKEEQHEEA